MTVLDGDDDYDDNEDYNDGALPGFTCLETCRHTTYYTDRSAIFGCARLISPYLATRVSPRFFAIDATQVDVNISSRVSSFASTAV
jgi:hypothetical protein